MSTWVPTTTGHRFDIVRPDLSTIQIEDIAIGLARQPRFNGHTTRVYSVAEHSLIGSAIMLRDRGPQLALEFLLHDASEAYLGDLSRPVKNLCPDFRLIEARVDAAIRLRFELPLSVSPTVKELDDILCATEANDLVVVPIPELGNRFLPKQLSSYYFGKCLVDDFLNMFHFLREQINMGSFMVKIEGEHDADQNKG